MANDRAPQEVRTAPQAAEAQAAADVAEALARKAVADACAEDALTRASFSKARRQLVWFYIVGGLVGAMIGLPAVIALGKLVVAWIRQ